MGYFLEIIQPTHVTGHVSHCRTIFYEDSLPQFLHFPFHLLDIPIILVVVSVLMIRYVC